jgi:hypothetical protein
VALIFDVVILWQRRNPYPLSAELSRLLENNLGPPVVLLHRAVDLDHFILQLAYIADLLKVVRKNHNGKRTHHGILAKIEEGDAPAGMFYPDYLAGDALVFPYVLPSLGYRNAAGGRESREEQC